MAKPFKNLKQKMSPEALARLAPEIKNRVARAAVTTGQELTAFAGSTLSDKANEVIKGHDELTLNNEEFQFFAPLPGRNGI